MRFRNSATFCSCGLRLRGLQGRAARCGRAGGHLFLLLLPPRRATLSLYFPRRRLVPWLRRAFPGPWWSTAKAFRTRSSRLLAKAEALGSIHYKLRVDVDERSAGGWRLEAVSRPRTASLSGTSNRGTRGRYGIHGGSLDEIRCVLHLPLTLIITHFCAASVLAGSC